MEVGEAVRVGEATGTGVAGGGVGWDTVGSGSTGVGLLTGLAVGGTAVGVTWVIAGGVGVAGTVLGAGAAALPQAVIKKAARSNTPRAARCCL